MVFPWFLMIPEIQSHQIRNTVSTYIGAMHVILTIELRLDRGDI